MPRDPHSSYEEALDLFYRGYLLQQQGDLPAAIEAYERSIALYPLAETHTFCGWAYSHFGDLDRAIAECHEAIRLDPDFGNPYNDIGAYLVQQGDLDGAIPWLQKAITAPRYEPRHYPHANLGRIYMEKEQYLQAREEFNRALELEPDYPPALEALAELNKQLN